MKVICLLGGQDEHRFQQNKKIGSRKSAVDYRELLWINRHMSISEWEAHCLSLHECDKDFWFPMWLNFTCLITALLFFFCRWSDHERNIYCYDLVYGNGKIVWKLKHLCCWTVDHVFCYILHWVLQETCRNHFSCFLKFNPGKVLLFLIDYDH